MRSGALQVRGPPPYLPRNAGLRRAVDALVDERFGVIKMVMESPHEPGEPAFFEFVAEVSATAKWLSRKPFGYGGGASVSRDLAVAKAVGEAIERYCAAIYDLDALPLTSARDASFPCVEPDRFALFSRAQHEAGIRPFVPFEEDTPVRWTEAVRVLDGTRMFVPAASVFLPYYDEGGEEIVIPPVSTGLASGIDPVSASVSGLLEVIERDAFCRCWYGMRSPPRIDRERLPERIVEIIGRFERCGYSVGLFDIRSDLDIPVVLAIATGEHRDAPALSIAASASMAPLRAATKALEELAMTLRYQRELKLSRHPGFGLAGDRHLSFWNDRDRRGDAAFLWASSDTIDISDPVRPRTPQEELAWLARRLDEHGFDAFICDITSADVAEAGMAVARAVVPGLQPLLFGEGMVAQGGTRLGAGPLNPHPHPFP